MCIMKKLDWSDIWQAMNADHHMEQRIPPTLQIYTEVENLHDSVYMLWNGPASSIIS